MPFFLIKFLESILPFLFNALKRSWDNLTKTQQDAIVNSGMIGQFLKNNLTAIGTDLVNAISIATGLTTAEVTNTLLSLAKTFGLTTDDVNKAVSFLQDKLSSASSTSEWNGLLTTILNAGATVLSGGTLDWLHVALGLGEWAYQQFVVPRTNVTIGIQHLYVSLPVASVSGIERVNPVTPDQAYNGGPSSPDVQQTLTPPEEPAGTDTLPNG